ncbi:MAG: hypothetical protein KC912_03090 [Proteobacteria bacterium]|nr:hypothetical protein [Pseudomonadota bacterium]
MRLLPVLLLLACTAGNDDTDSGPSDSADTADTSDTGPRAPALLAANGDRACAYSANTLSCWGDGASPATLAGVSGEIEIIAVSPAAACWMTSSGDVTCTPTSSETAPGERLTDWALHIAGGTDGFCAVHGDRTVSCWGEDETTPVDVSGALGAVFTTARAGTHAWTLNQANGVLQEWDWNQAVTTNTVIRGTEQVAPGIEHTCQRTTLTEAKCWGVDTVGQTGVDGSGTVSDADRVTAISSGVSALVSGTHHVCALLDDATVSCWGDNSMGQLGRGTVNDPTFATTPAAVPGLTAVQSIAAGDGFTCAALEDGEVKCWGEGTDGQLQGTADSATPTALNLP